MPLRNEPARLGEEQEQHAIDDDQRFVEEVSPGAAASRRERAEERRERLVHALLQRGADCRAVLVRQDSRLGEERWSAGERVLTEQSPEDRKRPLVVHGQVEIELREAARVRAFGVNDSERWSGQAEAPPQPVADALPHGVAPSSPRVQPPRRDDQRSHRPARRQERSPHDSAGRARRERNVEPEIPQQRGGDAIEDRPCSGCRPELVPCEPVPGRHPPLCGRGARTIEIGPERPGDRSLERVGREQRSGQRGNRHQSTSRPTSVRAGSSPNVSSGASPASRPSATRSAARTRSSRARMARRIEEACLNQAPRRGGHARAQCRRPVAERTLDPGVEAANTVDVAREPREDFRIGQSVAIADGEQRLMLDPSGGRRKREPVDRRSRLRRPPADPCHHNPSLAPRPQTT